MLISLQFFVMEVQTPLLLRRRIQFVNPTTLEPTLSFLSLKNVPSQDANGIKSALLEAFHDIGMPELIDRMVFLASDGASVNSGIKTGLVAKFRGDGISWLV